MCQTLSIKSSSNDLDCMNLYRARMFYHYVLCGYSCLQALESSLQNQTFLLYLYDIIYAIICGCLIFSVTFFHLILSD